MIDTMNPFRIPMRRRRHRAPQPPTVTTPVTMASTTDHHSLPIPREIEVPGGPPLEIVYSSSLTMSQGLASVQEDENQRQSTQPHSQHDSILLQRLQEEYFLVHPQRVHSLLLLNSADTIEAMLQQEQEERFLEQRMSRFPRPQHDNKHYQHIHKVDMKKKDSEEKKPPAARKQELSSPTTSFLLQNSGDFRESFHSLCQAFPDADPEWILKLMKEQGQAEHVGQVLLALSSQKSRPTPRPTLSRHDSKFARQTQYHLKHDTTTRRGDQRLDRDNDDDMQLRRSGTKDTKQAKEQKRRQNTGVTCREALPSNNPAHRMRDEMTAKEETPNERDEIVKLVLQVFPSTSRRRILDLLVYGGYSSAQSIIVRLAKDDKRARGRL